MALFTDALPAAPPEVESYASPDAEGHPRCVIEAVSEARSAPADHYSWCAGFATTPAASLRAGAVARSTSPARSSRLSNTGADLARLRFPGTSTRPRAGVLRLVYKAWLAPAARGLLHGIALPRLGAPRPDGTSASQRHEFGAVRRAGRREPDVPLDFLRGSSTGAAGDRDRRSGEDEAGSPPPGRALRKWSSTSGKRLRPSRSAHRQPSSVPPPRTGRGGLERRKTHEFRFASSPGTGEGLG